MSRDKLIGIYKITSPTGRIYIGKSTDIHKRWIGYKVRSTKNQTKLYNSFKKYGVENHIFEIVELCGIKDLSKKETYHITRYNSYSNFGLNLTGGGDGPNFLTTEARRKIGNFHKGNKYNVGRKVSEETKQKLRIIGKERIFTEEHRKNLSTAAKGKKVSKETREKISLKLVGNTVRKKGMFKHSIESKEKNRLAHLGKRHSEKSKRKVSESLKKQWKSGIRSRNINKGLKRSKEAIQKTAESRFRKINQYNTQEDFLKQWNSLKSAANHYKINTSSLSAALRIKTKVGKDRTCMGFIWKYAK